MGGVAREGRTVLFVSHNMISLEAICNKGYVLEAGRLCFENSIQRAISFYQKNLSTFSTNNFSKQKRVTKFDKSKIEVVNVLLCKNSGAHSNSFLPFEEVSLQIEYLAHSEIPTPWITWHIWKGPVRVFTADSKFDNVNFSPLKNNGIIQCKFKIPPLTPGMYTIKISIGEIGALKRWGGWGWEDGNTFTFFVEPVIRNQVTTKDEWGMGFLHCMWKNINYE